MPEVPQRGKVGLLLKRRTPRGTLVVVETLVHCGLRTNSSCRGTSIVNESWTWFRFLGRPRPRRWKFLVFDSFLSSFFIEPYNWRSSQKGSSDGPFTGVMRFTGRFCEYYIRPCARAPNLPFIESLQMKTGQSNNKKNLVRVMRPSFLHFKTYRHWLQALCL